MYIYRERERERERERNVVCNRRTQTRGAAQLPLQEPNNILNISYILVLSVLLCIHFVRHWGLEAVDCKAYGVGFGGLHIVRLSIGSDSNDRHANSIKARLWRALHSSIYIYIIYNIQ